MSLCFTVKQDTSCKEMGGVGALVIEPSVCFIPEPVCVLPKPRCLYQRFGLDAPLTGLRQWLGSSRLCKRSSVSMTWAT